MMSFFKSARMASVPAIALAAVFIAAPRSNAAPVQYSGGHADVGVGYESHGDHGHFHLHYHFGSTAILNGNPVGSGQNEYEPDEVVVIVGNNVLRSVSGSVASLFGPGVTQAYVFGQTTGGMPAVNTWPYLGIAAEELASGDWVGDISFAITGVNYTGDAANAKFAWFLSDSGLSTVGDVYYDESGTPVSTTYEVGIGGHDHINWGFSDSGLYEIEITVSGTHVTDGFVSETETFTFWVDYAPSSAEGVPEPSTWALGGLSLAGVGLMALRRRRTAKQTA